MSQKPNFLFIITDQQRADFLGCYGHPVLKTPNIDALAARGVAFDEFHTASPVCMPNRASIMTGRYPSVHGLRKNGLHLPEHNVTFVDALREEGYRTALIGKSHLQPFTGRNIPQTNPAAMAAIQDAWRPLSDDWQQEEPHRWEGEHAYHMTLPYYGFEHVDLVSKHGDRCGGHYDLWLRQQVNDPSVLQGPAHQLPHHYSCPQAYRTVMPEALHPTRYVEQQACAFINSQKDQEQPFFAFVSFPDPHHPFCPPGKYWDLYDPDDFKLPRPVGSNKNPPPYLTYLQQALASGQRQAGTEKGFMATDREVREAMALTCGMITMIDDAVGQMMSRLKASGLDDNTVVVFTSDHGDYMGDYNLLLKGPAPMRGITRVPMIWSDPAVPSAGRTDALTSAIDLAPSILERAGITPYHGIQGTSLLPLLQGTDWSREELLIEHEDNIAVWGFERPAQSRTLLREGCRLTLFQDQAFGELYDLHRDPDESTNLWELPDYAGIRSRLTERLVQSMLSVTDQSPWPKRIA